MSERHKQEVALLQSDIDAAIKSSESTEMSLNKEKFQVAFESESQRQVFPQNVSSQAQQRADNAESAARVLQQRVDEANKSLATQKQFAEAAAALAAADLHTMTQRATQAESQMKFLQEKISLNQVTLRFPHPALPSLALADQLIARSGRCQQRSCCSGA